MPKIRTFGWCATAAMLATTAIASPATSQEGRPGQEQAAQEWADAQLVLLVDGMSCPFCAYGLEKRLLKIEAVEALVIRVSDGEVRIRVREGETVTDRELEEAVKRAGFSLREVQRRTP